MRLVSSAQCAVLGIDPPKILTLKLQILGSSEGCAPPQPPLTHTHHLASRRVSKPRQEPRCPDSDLRCRGPSRAWPRRPSRGSLCCGDHDVAHGHASATLTLPYQKAGMAGASGSTSFGLGRPVGGRASPTAPFLTPEASRYQA